MGEVEIDAGLKIKPQEVKEKKLRIGLVVPCLNYFEGVVDLLTTVRTKHIVTTYVMPQYRERYALSKVWNDGAKRAFAEGCDYALICNDDILFAPETIDNFVTEFERLQSEGVILLTASNIRGQLNSKWDVLSFHPDQPTSTADHPDFSCFFIGKDFFDQVGTFDENFYPAWNEDLDMHYRIMLAGKRGVVSTACPINHLGSVTTAKMADKNSSQSDGHFITKWGSKNVHPPQAYDHPYNDPNKSYKEW